jgi:hypothetical protein
MESLRGVTEAIEAEFGESIVARDESLVVLAGAPGLGPPDLVWLQKVQKATLTSAEGEPRGFYHYSLGLDVSSSAAVAAYFADLTSRVDQIGFLQVPGGGGRVPVGGRGRSSGACPRRDLIAICLPLACWSTDT